MTMTPWGESETLRERRLRPGPGVSRTEVELNQRERLFGATVAVVANKGYGASTIADLIRVAGLSRTTFYKYFADKEACFLATLEVLVDGVVAVTASQLRGEDDWRLRAERSVSAFVELLIAQPDAARLCVVEAYAAGPRAGALVDAAAAEFQAMMASVFEELPGQRGMPAAMVKAMIGGLQKILHTRLHRHDEDELLAMVPDLVELGLRYQPPPRVLPNARPRRKVGPGQYWEGVDQPAERIERATMAVVARAGYADTTMVAIATEGGVSLRTFYSVFASKAEAFEAALLRSRLRMSAATLPAYRRAKSWPDAIAALVRASLAFLEARPDFARLITIDVYSAGAAALESRDRALESTEHFIAAGFSDHKMENPIAAEAVQSALYSLLSDTVRATPTRSLKGLAPLAIYMILAPVLGPDEAYAYAQGS